MELIGAAICNGVLQLETTFCSVRRFASETRRESHITAARFNGVPQLPYISGPMIFPRRLMAECVKSSIARPCSRLSGEGNGGREQGCPRDVPEEGEALRSRHEAG